MRGFGSSSGPGGDNATPPAAGGRPRSRDRHGRGIRGELAPAQVPLMLSRSQRFDEYVLDAVEEVERAVDGDPALGEQLGVVEFGIEEVPPDGDLAAAESGAQALPLARSQEAGAGSPARVVIYRRPVELRSPDLRDRAALVHELVVDELADLLGVPVDRLDPPPPD